MYKDLHPVRKYELARRNALQLERLRIKNHLEKLLLSNDSLQDEKTQNLIHEIKNPLTAIKITLNSLEADPHTEAIAIALESIQQIEQLIEAYKEGFVKSETFDIKTEIEIACLITKQKYKNTSINVDKVQNCQIIGPKVKFRQVIINLVDNASFAVKNLAHKKESRSQVCIKSKTTPTELKITIEDTGPGIEDTWLERVFEEGFSTKNSDGRGLSLCKEIVEYIFNGKIVLRNNSGLTVEIFIPRG